MHFLVGYKRNLKTYSATWKSFILDLQRTSRERLARPQISIQVHVLPKKCAWKSHEFQHWLLYIYTAEIFWFHQIEVSGWNISHKDLWEGKYQVWQKKTAAELCCAAQWKPGPIWEEAWPWINQFSYSMAALTTIFSSKLCKFLWHIE